MSAWERGEATKSIRGEQDGGGANRDRTAGTDRDLDEDGAAENQGHGHPRDRQQRSDRSGKSLEKLTEEDRRQRDLGGPGG